MAYIARGSNAGFQVPDELLMLFGNPKQLRGGRPPVIQVFLTRANNPLLMGTHYNGRPHHGQHQQLTICGSSVTATYYDGQYSGSAGKSSKSAPGPRWSRTDKHSLVFTVHRLHCGIRASRLGGVDQFHLLALAESLEWVHSGA